MKKFLAMLCAVALAALCAISAFAEATPGQAANELATKILNTANKGIMVSEAVEMTENIAANPTIPVTKEQANAAMGVMNAVGNTVVKKVATSSKVSNAISFESYKENGVVVNSLTRKDDKTLVLDASWSGNEAQPEMGVMVAVYGLESRAGYQLVYVADDGTRTTYDTQLSSANNAVVFWIPHFSTYEIVRVRDYVEPSDDSQTDADRAAQAAAAAAEAARVDAQFYTCPACGYHNWTGTVGGYKCDHCGHIEAKDLSSYPNVKGTATLAAASSTKAVGTNPIKATGADMNLMVLAVLVLAAAMVGGFACVARKHK